MQTNFDSFSAFDRIGEALKEDWHQDGFYRQVPLRTPAGREGIKPKRRRYQQCQSDLAKGIGSLDRTYAARAKLQAKDAEVADALYGRTASPEDAMIEAIDSKRSAKRRRSARRRQRMN